MKTLSWYWKCICIVGAARGCAAAGPAQVCLEFLDAHEEVG